MRVVGSRKRRFRRGGVIGRIFRARQIYLRSGSDVHYFSLGPLTQIFTLALLSSALFWTAYASINIAFKDKLLVLKERDMYQARLDYEERVAGLRGAIDTLNGKLLLDQQGYLAKVDEVRSDYNALVRQHEQLRRLFQQSFLPNVDRKESRGEPAGNPGLPAGKTGLNDEPFAERYRAAFASAEDAASPLGDMRLRLGQFETLQLSLLDEAKSVAEAKSARAAKLFLALGINPETLAKPAAVSIEGTGGPFLAATSADNVAKRMIDVQAEVAEFKALRAGAEAMPLYAPMRGIAGVSSTFGLRDDPLRRTPAFHSGVDFKGPWAEPVLTTADGIVVKAGWEGSYGRLVEIAHDNGVSTRYAHLSSVSVVPGQKVKRGDTVGHLGSSGRSTGPHLHYETRVEGKAVDPAGFWRMRNDLQAIEKETD